MIGKIFKGIIFYFTIGILITLGFSTFIIKIELPNWIIALFDFLITIMYLIIDKLKEEYKLSKEAERQLKIEKYKEEIKKQNNKI